MIISPATFERCDPKQSTDCVVWVGDEIPCLGVCKYDTLTELQTKVAQKVCDLIKATDATSLTIPTCFAVAFASRDKTVLNFLQTLLDTACTQASQIADLQDQLENIDPFVTLDYKCCSGNPCVNDATVHVSEAIQNVINCLCTQSNRITDLQNEIATLDTEVSNISSRFDNFINNQFPVILDQLNTTGNVATSALNKANCIINSLDNQSIPISC